MAGGPQTDLAMTMVWLFSSVMKMASTVSVPSDAVT